MVHNLSTLIAVAEEWWDLACTFQKVVRIDILAVTGGKNLDWANSNDFSISLIVSLEILLLQLTYSFYTVGWVFREERMFQRCG